MMKERYNKWIIHGLRVTLVKDIVSLDKKWTPVLWL